MTFEQPKRLNVVLQKRNVRLAYPAFIGMGLLLSAMLLFGTWQKAKMGQHFSPSAWIGLAFIGPLQITALLLMLRFYSERRYIEFRDNGFYLSSRGNIKLKRIVNWSISPDLIEPRYFRLQIIYKYGFGRKRWTLLLDDHAQVSQLRDGLKERLPLLSHNS